MTNNAETRTTKASLDTNILDRVQLPHLRTESDNWLHLDVLRFVAAVGVVWFHSHQFFHPISIRPTIFLQTEGYALFVDLFFVISGIIIAAVYGERLNDKIDYFNFLLRRFARLVPLHWLVLILTLTFFLTAQSLGLRASSPPDLSASCVLHSAMLFNGLTTCGTGDSLVPVTWSISVEMVLYIASPLLLLCAIRPLVFIATLLTVLTIFYWAFLSADNSITESIQLVRGITSFFIGNGLYRYRHTVGRLKFPSWAFVAVLFATMLSMQFGAHQLVTISLVWATVIVAMSSDLNKNAGSLVKRLAPLGQLTYGIYMWHYLFVTVLINAFADKLLKLSTVPMVAVAIVTYGLIGLCSYFSLFFFETPMRRKIDTMRISKRSVADA